MTRDRARRSLRRLALAGLTFCGLGAVFVPTTLPAQSIGVPLREGSGAERRTVPAPAPTPAAQPPRRAAPAPAPARPAAQPQRQANRSQAGRPRSAPYETSVPLFETVFVVGETPITGFDLEQRARLLEFGAGGRLENVEERALEELIADELKLAEARRLGVQVEDSLVSDAFDSIIARNRLSEEEFLERLARAGVERSTFERQLRADLLWGRALRARYGDRLEPSDDEVDAAVASSTAPTNEKRYDVRQLLVAVGPQAPNAQVRAAAEKAMAAFQAATSCSALSELAPRYSQGSGKVGDLTAAEMPGPVRSVVTGLDVGERTRPMRSRQGFHVIMLCGVEEGVAQVDRETVQRRLRNARLERFADSYLEDLRRNAYLERR